MSIENRLEATSREELRDWLMANSTTEGSCWIEVSLKPLPGTILYLDAVEEALCFGWIDGVKKAAADSKLIQRLSPRSKRSSWTELNKERVRRLEKLGLMRAEGRRCLPDMDEEAFRIDPVIEQRLKADEQVYRHFLAFPALYQRVRIDTIQSYIRQPELFERRLDKFIENTRVNKMYGQWHDGGRLLEY
ncbi:YdeI/OmpD-associated family protein [Paenibacillus sp. FSL P4-0338]|uniref:YdeI/OmpD-associated family protein n=1 Tax=unclassified Paenibacillus TaxID=185978 RepID=UPI0004B3C25B|nr:YdeI/OmpD-associated family protein [Paenibacillus sp. FSL R7-269]